MYYLKFYTNIHNTLLIRESSRSSTMLIDDDTDSPPSAGTRAWFHYLRYRDGKETVTVKPVRSLSDSFASYFIYRTIASV